MNIAEVFYQNMRSPLGIIGLFITLVYGIAGWLFAGIISSLSYDLQLLLVIFVIGYPCILLAVFCFLVTKHHKKLYAPIDFRTDEAFHRYSDPNTLAHKVEEYDPALKKELDDLSKAPDNKKSIESLTNMLGKEALALELISKHFAKKYGVDAIRRESFSKQSMDYGWDLVVRTARYSRLMIEVKLLSLRSPLEKIAAQAEKAHEMVVAFNNSGSSKERDYLLCAVVNEAPEKIKTVEEKLREIIKKNNYRFAFEVLSFSDLANNYTGS